MVLGFALDPLMGKRFMEFTDTITMSNQEKTEKEWVPRTQAQCTRIVECREEARTCKFAFIGSRGEQ